MQDKIARKSLTAQLGGETGHGVVFGEGKRGWGSVGGGHGENGEILVGLGGGKFGAIEVSEAGGEVVGEEGVDLRVSEEGQGPHETVVGGCEDLGEFVEGEVVGGAGGEESRGEAG